MLYFILTNNLEYNTNIKRVRMTCDGLLAWEPLTSVEISDWESKAGILELQGPSMASPRQVELSSPQLHSLCQLSLLSSSPKLSLLSTSDRLLLVLCPRFSITLQQPSQARDFYPWGC